MNWLLRLCLWGRKLWQRAVQSEMDIQGDERNMQGGFWAAFGAGWWWLRQRAVRAKPQAGPGKGGRTHARAAVGTGDVTGLTAMLCPLHSTHPGRTQHTLKSQVLFPLSCNKCSHLQIKGTGHHSQRNADDCCCCWAVVTEVLSMCLET